MWCRTWDRIGRRFFATKAPFFASLISLALNICQFRFSVFKVNHDTNLAWKGVFYVLSLTIASFMTYMYFWNEEKIFSSWSLWKLADYDAFKNWIYVFWHRNKMKVVWKTGLWNQLLFRPFSCVPPLKPDQFHENYVFLTRQWYQSLTRMAQAESIPLKLMGRCKTPITLETALNTGFMAPITLDGHRVPAWAVQTWQEITLVWNWIQESGF